MLIKVGCNINNFNNNINSYNKNNVCFIILKVVKYIY